jgi:hypothetical protein
MVPANDRAYGSGYVWQTNRKDWVWETGVSFSGGYPTAITGILVSGQSHTGYYVNYPQGRVVFNTPISTGSTVYINYSYKNIQIYKSDDAPWFQELQFNSLDAKDSEFVHDFNTGSWSIGSYHRIQLPAIVIQTLPQARSTPYEMGNSTLTLYQDILFYILTEDLTTRNNLISILLLQNDKYIRLFDDNRINADGAFPLNYRGERINSLSYPNLVADTGYFYKNVRITKCMSTNGGLVRRGLYDGLVRATLVIDNI